MPQAEVRPSALILSKSQLMLTLSRRKCDRQQPCNLCKVKGVASRCTFQNTVTTVSAPSADSADVRSPYDIACELDQMLQQLQIPATEADKMSAIFRKVRRPTMGRLRLQYVYAGDFGTFPCRITSDTFDTRAYSLDCHSKIMMKEQLSMVRMFSSTHAGAMSCKR
jgi:hypothetical protein